MNNPRSARKAFGRLFGVSSTGQGERLRMTDTRQSDRVPLNCDVEFKRHGDARYKVDLLDFSPHGCCISPPIRVEQGESISLRIPDMEAIHGRIAWVRDWKAGIQFDHPFHEAVFELVVRRLEGPSATS